MAIAEVVTQELLVLFFDTHILQTSTTLQNQRIYCEPGFYIPLYFMCFPTVVIIRDTAKLIFRGDPFVSSSQLFRETLRPGKRNKLSWSYLAPGYVFDHLTCCTQVLRVGSEYPLISSKSFQMPPFQLSSRALLLRFLVNPIVETCAVPVIGSALIPTR